MARQLLRIQILSYLIPVSAENFTDRVRTLGAIGHSINKKFWSTIFKNPQTHHTQKCHMQNKNQQVYRTKTFRNILSVQDKCHCRTLSLWHVLKYLQGVKNPLHTRYICILNNENVSKVAFIQLLRVMGVIFKMEYLQYCLSNCFKT